MKRLTYFIWAFFLISLWCCKPAGQIHPLGNQIIIDKTNPGYLVYNRDNDHDGKPDPFYLIGPGDPEGFLYLGKRNADGTREDNRQQQILSQMRQYGGNGLYFQAVRSNGGDGENDHNPWNDPGNPASGLNKKIISQWRGWFDEMKDAGIILFFFIYDDGVHPFDDGCTGTVGTTERNFIKDLITSFKDYPNLIWVLQEECKFVGQGQNRRPCDEARVKKMKQLAALVKEFDDHGHLVGVHHNTGEKMAFPDEPNIDIYVQQADVQPVEGRGNLDALHEAGLPGNGFDTTHHYAYIMAEAYNWHPTLVLAGDRIMLRKSYYATAMAGGHVMVLGMFAKPGGPDPGVDPSQGMLEDMKHMQKFFESTSFNFMSPHDELAVNDTRWILCNPQKQKYILYTDRGDGIMGVKNLQPGKYNLRWFDPATGLEVRDNNVTVEEGTIFRKPSSMGQEIVLCLDRTKSD